MFVTMKPLLDHAARHHYAVMAANVLNMEMARAVIGAADEKQAPLIIIIGSMAMAKHSAAELVVPMIRRLAGQTLAPIALCLDHGKDIHKVAYALHNGFNSIMLDGSQYEMEENIEKTRQIVELCHPLHISVEGEIGHVGQAASLDGRDASLYTKPEDAAYFAKATGVDCLAVAIGTAHGKYPQGFVPHINLELLREIKEAVNQMPIALHGGSGSGDENILAAVEAGINKINLATDLQEAAKKGAGEAFLKGADYIQTLQEAELSCKRLLMHWMELSGSCNRAKDIPVPWRFSDLQGDHRNHSVEE